MVQEHWQVRRLAGSLARKLRVWTLNEIASGDQAGIDAVGSLLLEHQVIFFPDQNVDIDSHVALVQRFGKIENHQPEEPFHSTRRGVRTSSYPWWRPMSGIPTSPLKISRRSCRFCTWSPALNLAVTPCGPTCIRRMKSFHRPCRRSAMDSRRCTMRIRIIAKTKWPCIRWYAFIQRPASKHSM